MTINIFVAFLSQQFCLVGRGAAPKKLQRKKVKEKRSYLRSLTALGQAVLRGSSSTKCGFAAEEETTIEPQLIDWQMASSPLSSSSLYKRLGGDAARRMAELHERIKV